jgi:hypothetical protein
VFKTGSFGNGRLSRLLRWLEQSTGSKRTKQDKGHSTVQVLHLVGSNGTLLDVGEAPVAQPHEQWHVCSVFLAAGNYRPPSLILCLLQRDVVQAPAPGRLSDADPLPGNLVCGLVDHQLQAGSQGFQERFRQFYLPGQLDALEGEKRTCLRK